MPVPSRPKSNQLHFAEMRELPFFSMHGGAGMAARQQRAVRAATSKVSTYMVTCCCCVAGGNSKQAI